MTAGGPSGLDHRLASLSPEKRALLAQRLGGGAAHVRVAAEPIAIVGMACRFPGGADSPEAFWSLLADGVDAISEVPPERWDVDAVYDPDPAVPGRTSSRHGGFLRGVDRFDAGFFGISPREAARMDPQQRLFLEVAWEALDDAGQDVQRLAGTATGVFVGLHSHASDYFWLDLARPAGMDAFTGPGTSHNIVPGRLSYLFDFQGPSLVVDTACSSSLVAIHLACQSLRTGESTLALAGGVNLVLSPLFTIALSRLQMLSPRGRCRAFDAGADGFVRAEGCGVLVLKRLVDARAAGDRVLAVIRGSAANQDGRTNGITAPNSQSQQRVVTRALADAGLAGAQIGYVEAHGTGTALGDPIEIEALTAVVGQPRADDRRCLLGSAKANIGHAEGAAGVAGVIKAVLSLRHRAVPPLALFETLNPHVSLEGTAFTIPTTLTSWDSEGQPRLAGVSSFGWSGTNAHVILEEAAEPSDPAPAGDGPWLLAVSARSEEALHAMVGKYVAMLQAEEGPPLADVCHSAAVRRTHHEYRVAVSGRTREQMVDRLRSSLDGGTSWAVAQGRAVSGRRQSAVFVCSGQGPQWWAMGRELLAESRVFRERLEQCAATLDPLTGWSLIEALTAEQGASRLDRTEVAQPALFALQLGLAAVWEAWGIIPTAVVGHSVGELSAAVIAGAMTLEEAARVVHHRGRLMQRATGGGRMAAVELSQAEAMEAVRPFGSRLAVAAVNAPGSCVLSGGADALEALVRELQDRGVTCRPLPVDYAFHSAQMDGISRDLVATLGQVHSAAPRIPLLSTVTGRAWSGEPLDAAYWGRNVRQPVLFGPAIETLAARGERVFVELGPHPVLSSSIAPPQSAAHERVALASLHRGRPEMESLLASLGGLHVSGYPVDWTRVMPAGRSVPLPVYAWQRASYWLPVETQQAPIVAAREASEPSIPGSLVRSPNLRGPVFECELSANAPAWLADHRISDLTLVPATAFITMVTAAAAHVANERAAVEDFFIHQPLPLPPGEPRIVQTLVLADGAGFTIEIHSRPAGEHGEWTLHVTARTRVDAPDAPQPHGPRATVPACAEDVPVQTHYEAMRAQGADLGPLLRTATRIARCDGEAVGQAAATAAHVGTTGPRYWLHPAVLDGCLQPMLAALPLADPRRGQPYLPQAVSRIRVVRAAVGTVTSHVVLRPAGHTVDLRIVGDIRITDETGALVASLEGVAMARAASRPSAGADRATGDLFYTSGWAADPGVQGSTLRSGPGHWVIFVDGGGLGTALSRELEARGRTCTRIVAGQLPGMDLHGATEASEMSAWCAAILDEAGPLEGVVHLWSLDSLALPGMSAEVVEAGQRVAAGSALAVIQALVKRSSAPPPKLHIVTRGSQAVVAHDVVEMAQSPVSGLARVAALEHPDLRLVVVDLDPRDPEGAGPLLAELAASDLETEVAFRAGQRFVRRLRRRAGSSSRPEAPGPQAVDIANRGTLDGLTLVPLVRERPGPGCIEIEVRASGLNFRDVLNVLGTYPGHAGRPGSECSGVVSAVGEEADGFRVGDAVMALAEGAMATHVVTPARRAVRKPAGLSFEEAAALPIAFLTAEYALRDLAGLTRGERVLIHAAAGGVGLAAVQVAQRLGAEIYATAGSAEKQAFLRSLGVEHVFGSRSVEFAAQILERTNGRGVDVALNSLAGDFIPRTLDTLGPDGRFVEIGKTGIWAGDRVRAVRPDVGYHVLYLGDVFESDPARTHEMLADLAQAMEARAMRPLPTATFPMHDSAAAFRYMAQAKQIGKVVLSQSGTPFEIRARTVVRPDGTYLITGGLGSLGLQVARWLVDAGARHIVLMGRTAAAASGGAALAMMEASGADVRTEAGDVASRADVDRVLAGIAARMPAVRGIVHAAGVLDDGVLAEQSWARMAAVMGPKVRGAWNLHQATQSSALDFFVLFSGAASLLGSPGQANYAAANAFLDGLAHHRRRAGLPAVAINWGPWAGGGMAAQVTRRTAQRWADQGMHELSPSLALEALEQVLEGSEPQVAVLRMDWPLYVRHIGRTPPFLSEMVGASKELAPGRERLLDTLTGIPPARRLAALIEHVRSEALYVLGLPSSYPLDPDQGLRDVGLDSLMSVELRNRLQTATATHLATTLAFDYPTVRAIAGHLAGVAGLDLGEDREAEADGRAPVAVEDDVDGLSDAEAEAMLRAELAGLASAERGGHE